MNGETWAGRAPERAAHTPGHCYARKSVGTSVCNSVKYGAILCVLLGGKAVPCSEATQEASYSPLKSCKEQRVICSL